MAIGDDGSEESTAVSPIPSGNTGRGVSVRGKLKWLNHEGIAKAIERSASEVQCANPHAKSPALDPKGVDLSLGRMKCAERCMEVRMAVEVQFTPLTRV